MHASLLALQAGVTSMVLSPEGLAALVAIVLSLAMTYFPGLNAWHASLSPDWRRALWAVLLLLVAAGALFYSCNFMGACIAAGWRSSLDGFIKALILGGAGSQVAHAVSPEPAKVVSLKAGSQIRQDAQKGTPAVRQSGPP